MSGPRPGAFQAAKLTRRAPGNKLPAPGAQRPLLWMDSFACALPRPPQLMDASAPPHPHPPPHVPAAGSSSKMNPNENTGRWTQEEHERFLQGLELFGKKWTKVAEVVRTRYRDGTAQTRVARPPRSCSRSCGSAAPRAPRGNDEIVSSSLSAPAIALRLLTFTLHPPRSNRTTVQVRSHAQKYFQKMVKGKHDGEPTAGTGAGVRKAGQAARGGLDIDNLRKQLPVPASLQPYLPAGGGDIATGLYRYLSPNEIPTGTPPVATTGSVPEDNRNSYPTWFQQAKTMDDLLVEAAQLDWTHDTGNRPGGAEDDDGHGGEDDDEEGGPRMQVERGSLEVPMPSPVDVSHMHSLPPAPAQAPALEPNFSSMEVSVEAGTDGKDWAGLGWSEMGAVEREGGRDARSPPWLPSSNAHARTFRSTTLCSIH
mmetsp:Transcript_75628/g.215200  ORF Transcript_75628/g.215200 Transcript_75628/m.215200 type:complete len:425 (+) Transcript_75628:216-1490(+)